MVSVIIPNYNHAQYLDLRIQSVLNQTYGDFEVIILDDCSTDNSKQVIEQYKNHPKISLIIYNEVNSGSTFKQWQKGIAVAQGDWIWVAESDDYSASTFLSELTVLISKDESIGLAYCNSNRVDKDGEKVNVSTRSIYNDLLFSHKPHESWMEQGWKVFRDQLMVQCTIPNASAVLVRKDLIKLFIEESCYFKLTGDWILWSNISFQTTIAYHPLPLNFFRHHEGSVRAATGSVKLKVTEYGKIRTMFD